MRATTKNLSVTAEVVGLGTSLRRYWSVMLALLLREEAARRQAPLETVLNLAEPMGLIALMTGARYLLDRLHLPQVGDSVLLFYATGFFAKYLFIYVSRRMAGPIRSARQRFPIEQRLDHIFVHAFMRTLDYAILGVIMFGGIYLVVTPMAFPFNFVPIIQACLALALLGLGWGMINLVMSDFFWPWAYVTPTLNRSLILFSGIFYISDFLPEDARYILGFNPLVHAITLFRMGFYPGYPNLILDTDYLVWWVVGSLVVGFMFERVSRRYVTR